MKSPGNEVVKTEETWASKKVTKGVGVRLKDLTSPLMTHTPAYEFFQRSPAQIRLVLLVNLTC